MDGVLMLMCGSVEVQMLEPVKCEKATVNIIYVHFTRSDIHCTFSDLQGGYLQAPSSMILNDP